jgi:cytochrome P450
MTPSLLEGPEHHRVHRWWMRAFSGRALQALGDTLIRPVAHAEIDRFAARGHAELGAEFADRVAPRVIAAALGLPWEDDAWIDRVLALHRSRLRLIGLGIELDHAAPELALQEEAQAASRALAEIVRPHVEARRDGAGEDFISLLWRDAAELFGPGDRVLDVIGAVNVAFSGGSGSIAAAATSCIYVLLARPDLQEAIRDGDERRLATLVEEALRLYGPTVLRPRIAKRDTELGGARIAAGDLVIVVAGAANRDGERFGSPDEIDLERDAPRAHFTFHSGPRTCPGQGLARIQLATIVSVLLERLDDLRLDPAAEPPRYRDHFRRQWRPLHAWFSSDPGRRGR